jgi:hypothetical protein
VGGEIFIRLGVQQEMFDFLRSHRGDQTKWDGFQRVMIKGKSSSFSRVEST